MLIIAVLSSALVISPSLSPLVAKKTVTRVVVLPFRNAGISSPDTDSLGDEFTVSVIQALRQVKDLHVYDPGSVRAYYLEKLKFVQASGIGDEEALREGLSRAEVTDVDRILKGSYRIAGGKIQVTAALIDAAGSVRVTPVSEIDAYPDGLFGLQRSIALKAATAIDPSFGSSGDQLNNYFSMTENRDAQRFYAKGISAKSETTAAGYAQALVHFKKALDADNSFLLAYHELIDTRDRITKNAMGVIELSLALGFDVKDIDTQLAVISGLHKSITDSSRTIIEDCRKLSPSKFSRAEERYRASPYRGKYLDARKSVEYFPNDLEVLLRAWKEGDNYGKDSAFRRKIESINANYLPLKTGDFFNGCGSLSPDELTAALGQFNKKNPTAHFTEIYSDRFVRMIFAQLEKNMASGADTKKQFTVLQKHIGGIQEEYLKAIKTLRSQWK